MIFFYNIFVNALILGMRIFALFDEKTKKGIKGRDESLSIIKSSFSKSDKVIWMHAASLGEYEQGLPVLEKLKKSFPEHKILVTFFSPSGYENVIKKNHPADAVCYLPFDKKAIVKEFVGNLNIELFFTVKYDYWYNLLRELKNRNIRTYVISALFYDRQVYFKSYGKWFVKQLRKNIDWFFHQTVSSCSLAKSIGLDNSSIAGDTRFDRVRQLRIQANTIENIEDFIDHKKTIVFGSSWEAEEKILAHIARENPYIKLIIAPHDLKRVPRLKQNFPDAVLYSEIYKNLSFPAKEAQILIIDSIGLLSKLYSYAGIAVVGGGFHNAGLHNILEAATFGVPVIFGNHYKKNPEADELIDRNGGRSFDDEVSATTFILSLLHDDKLRHEMSGNAERFVNEKPNSSELILKHIQRDFNIN
ncbi:glycosyltransferase N-terminal domain-containing protein [Chryseobacterium sp.]|uniref:3-deoxy-D-manno-octulosonic acid transferase n=1 Tax=Chryseobacterium sp. TaxID=1871047 RepID=UPI0025C61F94|nr:glycosyltransferase N-terminal domain-containing protein [Chryseobacterium sp.]